MSDEIIVMSKGKIEQRGDPHDIYTKPVNRYVSNFIGVANLLDCQVVEAGKSGSGVAEISGGEHARLPCQLGPGVAAGGRAILSVRPENVHASRQRGRGATIEGEITHVIFLGNVVDCRVQSGDFEWKVLGHPRDGFKTGEKVFLRLDPDHTMAVEP
jgi:ABC-type Fe3+/spermidine/putrescine transport system ATPase subunit